MFDTQNNNQLRSPGTELASPQEQTAAYLAVSVNPGATLLPAHDPAQVVALLAWAVRTAEVFLSQEEDMARRRNKSQKDPCVSPGLRWRARPHGSHPPGRGGRRSASSVLGNTVARDLRGPAPNGAANPLPIVSNQ